MDYVELRKVSCWPDLSLRRLPKGGENSEKESVSVFLLWLFEFHTRYETT